MSEQAVPRIVTKAEWQRERGALLALEKAHTRAGDALAARRRRLPMVRIEKDYAFTGPDGRRSLLDLFEGRRQLIVYHFMFGDDWEAGCSGCSMFVDSLPHAAHLRARDTSLVLVSIAKLAKLVAYRERMGWSFPWVSSSGSDFNVDFGATTAAGGETFAYSVFLRDDDDSVYLTYQVANRGVESLGTVWTLLDTTPFGRMESWEDSPEGWPQTQPFAWWRRHDEYDDGD